MPDLADGLRWAARGALDLVLPSACLTCDAPVAEPGQLCPDCFRQTAFITEPLCPRCGAPFQHARQSGEAAVCPSCLAMPPEFGRARAAFRYDAQSRRIILPFKHGDRTDLARALAPHMVRAGAALLAEAGLLVPVPLHRRRLFARRYNQSGLLAHAIGRLCGLPVAVDALRRVRATAPLGRKSAHERAAEMADAITIRPGREARIAGRRVLLIDDVLTTGATANACARALHAAGAVSVDVLAAARPPDPRLLAR
jgi:ComF family protein